MRTSQMICTLMAIMLIVLNGAGAMAYTSHVAIRIVSNNDFSSYPSSGDGTESNAWIIEDLDIDGDGYGYCIYIGNTTDYFTISECYLHDAYISTPDDVYRPNAGIVLNNVENAIITDNEIESNYCLGIFLFSSSENIIHNNNITDN